MVLSGTIASLRRDFLPVSNLIEGFSGFIRKDYIEKGLPSPREIVEERGKIADRGKGIRAGHVHVKPLKFEENEGTISTRFENALRLHRKESMLFPKPLGIIYDGNAEHILLGEAQGYFLTQFIEGEDLINVLDSLDEEDRILFFEGMGYELECLRTYGMYLLDFAPRDIILRNGEIVDRCYADTEHVKYLTGRNTDSDKGRELLREQIAEFRKGYNDFVDEDELSHVVRLVFTELAGE